jgi:hypothetical protein
MFKGSKVFNNHPVRTNIDPPRAANDAEQRANLEEKQKQARLAAIKNNIKLLTHIPHTE